MGPGAAVAVFVQKAIINYMLNMDNYSITELESMAVELHKKYTDMAHRMDLRHMSPKMDIIKHIDNMPPLDEILDARKRRLNKTFKYTPRNIARLLKINKLLADSLEKGRREARPLMLELEQRLKNKDPFLKDYELDVKLQPFIGSNTGKPGIYEILEDTIHSSSTFMNDAEHEIKDYYGDNGDNCTSVHFINWNTDSGLHHEEFKKHYICYPMHELCDHSFWSLQDIIKITMIWIDVKVELQHFARIRSC